MQISSLIMILAYRYIDGKKKPKLPDLFPFNPVADKANADKQKKDRTWSEFIGDTTKKYGTWLVTTPLGIFILVMIYLNPDLIMRTEGNMRIYLILQ